MVTPLGAMHILNYTALGQGDGPAYRYVYIPVAQPFLLHPRARCPLGSKSPRNACAGCIGHLVDKYLRIKYRRIKMYTYVYTYFSALPS